MTSRMTYTVTDDLGTRVYTCYAFRAVLRAIWYRVEAGDCIRIVRYH